MVLRRFASLVFPVLFLLVSRSAAQGTPPAQPPASQLQSADAFYQRGDWNGAADAYNAIAASYPAHALSRFRAGVALLELKRYAESDASIRKAEQIGAPAAQAAFRLAQILAEQNRGDAAMLELTRAATSGYAATMPALQSDGHLARLRQHAKWQSTLDIIDTRARPCMHDARYREFDFWIGDWDVRTTGQPPVGPAARNSVTLDDNGCVLTEHWIAPSGSEGQSFNMFDRSFGTWRQTWVSNTGAQHDYRGALTNGNMVYTGELPPPPGQSVRVPTRLTFFHISQDSVRQFSEVSRDSGRTWVTNYDFMYVRRKDTSPVSGAQALTQADRAAIRALDSTFVRGWLSDDTTAVLSVFHRDAVLLPPGTAPVTGVAAIRAYWWPTDGSHTVITSFDRSITEIEGSRSLAFIRGTGTLGWAYTKAGKRTVQASRSIDLFVVAPDVDGQWRVIRQIWSALP